MNIEKEIEKVDKEMEEFGTWRGILTSFEGVVVGLIFICFLGLIIYVWWLKRNMLG